MALLRVNHGRASRAIADQLQNHFLILCAVEVMAACRVLHETAGRNRDSGSGIESVPGARPPSAFQYDGITIIRMKMRTRHQPRRKLHTDDIHAGLGWISRNHRHLYSVVAW